MKKIAIITNITAPYRKRQFQLLNEKFQGQLDIYYTHKDLQDRKWQVEWQENYFYLDKILGFKQYGNLNRGLLNIVKEYDCMILGGYYEPTYIILSVLCMIYNKPYIIVHDGIAQSRVNTEKNGIKLFIKRFVVRNAPCCLTNGEISKNYFIQSLKAKPGSVINQYLSVDERLFNNQKLDKWILQNKFKIKHDIKKDCKLILYSGRLILRKNISDIINSIADLDYVVLLIAGHGADQERLRRIISATGVKAVFLGHLEPVELTEIYFLSDCLVLASRDEPWGLVVNEALLANVPVVVSDDCGCYLDLVVQGKNGYVFPVGKIMELQAAILKGMRLDPVLIKQTNDIILEKWNLYKSVESIMQAIKLVKIPTDEKI